MKEREDNLKPFHVIQIFSNSYHYDKEYKEFETRKEWVKWKKEIVSSTQIEDKTVLVTQKNYEKQGGSSPNLVILLDSNFYTEEDKIYLSKLDSNYNRYKYYKKEKQQLIFSTLSNRKIDLEIFKIRQNETTKEIELFFHWNYWKMGGSERESFKLSELKVNKPINIKTDGRQDFSMSGRRKRTFIENNYIIEYKGIFSQIEIIKEDKIFYKQLPNLEAMKEINLMKHLK